MTRKAKFLYDDTDSDSEAQRSSALKRDSALQGGLPSDPSYSNFTNLKNTKIHINDHVPQLNPAFQASKVKQLSLDMQAHLRKIKQSGYPDRPRKKKAVPTLDTDGNLIKPYKFQLHPPKSVKNVQRRKATQSVFVSEYTKMLPEEKSEAQLPAEEKPEDKPEEEQELSEQQVKKNQARARVPPINFFPQHKYNFASIGRDKAKEISNELTENPKAITLSYFARPNNSR